MHLLCKSHHVLRDVYFHQQNHTWLLSRMASNFYDMSSENDHFGETPITNIFFAEETQVFTHIVILKLYSSKFVWDVTNNMDIIRKYIEYASFWCKFHHHCLFYWGDTGDWNLPTFTSFTIIVDFKAGLLQICMGCHQQYGDLLKVHRKGFILVQVLSR